MIVAVTLIGLITALVISVWIARYRFGILIERHRTNNEQTPAKINLLQVELIGWSDRHAVTICRHFRHVGENSYVNYYNYR